MSIFSTSKSISGQEVSVRANNKARTYTIKTNGTTYRTYPFNKIEFEDAYHNTADDWLYFIHTNTVKIIKFYTQGRWMTWITY